MEFAYLCLLPVAAVLGVLVVGLAEVPISWMMKNKVSAKIVFPKKPAKITATRYEELKNPPPGGEWVGRFERAFLFVAILAGAPALVGIWFAFKVASKWDAWSNIYQVPAEIKDVDPIQWFLIRRAFGARIYQRFLIGTAANFLAATIGAGIIRGTFLLIKHFS